MSQRKQKTILVLLILAALTLPVYSYAAGLVPCGGPTESPCTVQDIFALIARVTNWLIAIAGIFAVFQIISNGWWLVVTVGNEESITKRKNGITTAIVGLVIVMMAYMFINTAVNLLLFRGVEGCKINLANPLEYMIRQNRDGCDIK